MFPYIVVVGFPRLFDSAIVLPNLRVQARKPRHYNEENTLPLRMERGFIPERCSVK